MKLVTLGLTLVVSLTLSSCASVDSNTQMVLDYDRIEIVNTRARFSPTHTNVIWVNPPRKRVKKKQD